jgi:hypothetical protein
MSSRKVSAYKSATILILTVRQTFERSDPDTINKQTIMQLSNHNNNKILINYGKD